MAVATKFNVLVENLADKILDIFGVTAGMDVLKVMLVNSPAPVATNSVKADLTEIAAGNGYTAGGEAVPNRAGTRSAGTMTLAGDKIVWTATGGSIGPFRYPVLYDDTPITPADPLMLFWDYGSSLTLAVGETFSWKPNNLDIGGSILTLS